MKLSKKTNGSNKSLAFFLDVYKILSFLLFFFILLLLLSPFSIRVFQSEWLFMYFICVFGFVLGIVGNLGKARCKTVGRIGKIALFGNGIIAFLFFPPIYYYWGTLLEALLAKIAPCVARFFLPML